MNKKGNMFLSILLLVFLFIFCGSQGDFVLVHQKTGHILTNCYLLYDSQSKEAALIDAGGPIDSLVAHIHENNLKLKYIFATHCHMDHVINVPVIQEKFPKAKVGYNREDYQNFLIWEEWMEKHMDKKEIAYMKQNPEIAKWFDLDMSIFKTPDIELDDNQIYKLGDLEIKTFLSPGHSAGSICFLAGDMLFSGDVLFYRRVGRTDLLGGSKEAIIKSARRLYAELSDETRVYPGHGQFTTIGYEKKENTEVSLYKVDVQN